MIKENKNILKAQFKSDFSSLREILNQHDIIGFMPDLPVDEYDCINQSLLSLLYQNKDLDSIKGLLKTEINEHFGLNSNQDFIDKLAADIYDWWNEGRIIKNAP
jgi:hypothetical protein